MGEKKMKKLFLSLVFIVASTICFAENAISLNLGNVITVQNLEIYKFKTSMFGTSYGLNAEYNYIFDNNFIIGVIAGIGFDNIMLDVKNKDLKYEAVGSDISFAPEFGFLLSRRHFYTLLLQPIYLNSIAIAKTGGGTDYDSLYDIGYTATCTTLKSGFKFNFQWGGLCKNGFYIGAYIPWLRNITDAKLKDVDLKDESSKDVGFEIVLGYRISFVF